MRNNIFYLPPRNPARLAEEVCINDRVELLRYDIASKAVWFSVVDGVDVSLLVPKLIAAPS